MRSSFINLPAVFYSCYRVPVQGPTECGTCRHIHYPHQACQFAPPRPSRVEKSLRELLKLVWTALSHRRSGPIKESLTADDIADMMRKDGVFALPERGFDQEAYALSLKRSKVPPKNPSKFYQVELAACGTPTHRIYINAWPSRAAEVFDQVVELGRDQQAGIVRAKIWDSRSWKGGTEIVVVYCNGEEAAHEAATILSNTTTGMVRTATMPATLEVAPGFGVAWDPQQHFRNGNNDDILAVCFGATHTERYARMIETYLIDHAELSQGEFVEKFAPWMAINKYGDALKPHLPPPQYAQKK